MSDDRPTGLARVARALETGGLSEVFERTCDASTGSWPDEDGYPLTCRLRKGHEGSHVDPRRGRWLCA